MLDDISFDIPEHASVAVLGRNGVGKTTLLLTIMGHTDVARGAIRWRGGDMTAMAHRRAVPGSAGWRRNARYFLRCPWRKT